MEIFLAFFGILFVLVGSTFSGVQGKARDTERQTDIKAMHGQVEAYYAMNGHYPTISNINDESWRRTNMQGLDVEALKDPDGTEIKLVSSPAKDVYSYKAVGSNGSDCNNTNNDCTSYELVATLDDGTTFSKSALN